MADIQQVVDALSEEALSPAPPDRTTTPEPELTEEQIAGVVERITKPWQYGTCLSRFARQLEVPLDSVIKVKKACDTRRRAIQLAKVDSEEPVKEP